MTAAQRTRRLAAAMWRTARHADPIGPPRPAGPHVGAVHAVQPGTRRSGRAAGLDPSVDGPRLTGGYQPIPSNPAAGNTL
jgi:hypothetical protein